MKRVRHEPGRPKLRAGGRVLQQLRANHGGRAVFRVLSMPLEDGGSRGGGRALASTGGESPPSEEEAMWVEISKHEGTMNWAVFRKRGKAISGGVAAPSQRGHAQNGTVFLSTTTM